MSARVHLPEDLARPEASDGTAPNSATSARYLRSLFAGKGIVRAIGAHDALGARIGERAGFDAIWSSGLEVTASHGLPDADIMTMSELLAAAEWIASSVSIPVIADCDAGYGNAVNVANMVRRYEAAKIAAVCIEDKPFPKVNSFIPGRQRLLPIREFAAKLRAAKDAQTDPDFMVIARIEALVAGLGLDEALQRGHAYADAGADAVLIHAKSASPQPVLDFLAEWRRPTPVVVVPTTYFDITADDLHKAGAKLVIYANHGLRASVRAVSETLQEIYRMGGTFTVEDRIASLATIFDLQGVARLKEQEAAYLDGTESDTEAVVLGAGDEWELFEENKPLPALDIVGRSMAERQTQSLHQGGVGRVTVIVGAGAEHVRVDEALIRVDDNSAEHGEVETLLRFCPEAPESLLVVAGDLLFDSQLVRRMLLGERDIVIGVAPLGDSSDDDAGTVAQVPLVRLASGSRVGNPLDLDAVEQVVGFGPGGDEEVARLLPLVRLSRNGISVMRDVMKRSPAASAPGRGHSIADVLAAVIAEGHPVHYVPCAAGWTRISTEADLRAVRTRVTR